MKTISQAIYFNHGSDSTPWGEKVQRLSEVGREKGFAIESIDYTGINDPDERVNMLLNSQCTQVQQLILVGSSMGGYVATIASRMLQPRGLFLLAPAFYMDGFQIQDPQPYAEYTTVIHGWQDKVIPVENSIRFSQKHNTNL